MKTMSKRCKTLFGGGLVLLFSLLVISNAVAQTCVQPPAGLVSWWPGNGNANDSQDGHHGTLQNGATFAPGIVGQAFSFDGVDDFVEVPQSADFNPSGAFTVDGWFYIDPNAPSNAGDAATLVSKSDYQDTGGGWLLLFEDRTVAGLSKALSFQVYQGQAAFVSAEAQNVVTTADWYHIAGVFDPTATPRAKLYLNGNLIGSSTTSISSVTPNNLNVRIGAAYCNDPNCTGTRNDRFNGLADEVEFFNVALTQAQIQAIFDADSAGKCTRCSSTVLTIAGLQAEVEALNTSPATIAVLQSNLNNVQTALDNGNNETARTRLATFIDRLVNRSNFTSTNPDRILLTEANSLVCGAANVLTSIPLE